LWPEMLRVIREIQPTWIVGENVFGLVNWSDGLVFDEVQTDLEAAGYEVQSYVLPACAADAPHRRDRVWIVAYADSIGRDNGSGNREERQLPHDQERIAPESESERGRRLAGAGQICGDGDAAYSNGIGQPGEKHGHQESGFSCENSKGISWHDFPTQSPVCSRDDGIPDNPHFIAISKERNNMDRNLVIKSCLDEGRLKVDFKTGAIYSLKQRGREGDEIKLNGSNCNGYIVHGIRYNGFKIQLKAHQIVWIAANGLYDKSKLMIDHINRNRMDNRLDNLRLVDAKGNRENSAVYNGRLTDEQKDEIVWMHKVDGIPLRELAEDYGMSKSRIHQIVSEHSLLFGTTYAKWRNKSIKAAGNAIVPQIAYRIFDTINQYNKQTEQ
jgi:site-specific DNA-cytosine methylase